MNTLFLDRDGVINNKIEGSYIKDHSNFEFCIGALLAIKRLTAIFNRLIIVTNQQGIGKGIMSEKDLDCLHAFMLSNIREAGGRIDKIYHCPHLSTQSCECRKPKTGMILQAMQDFPDISISGSYLIGDSESDILAGKEMSLITVKVNNNYTLLDWCNDLLLTI